MDVSVCPTPDLSNTYIQPSKIQTRRQVSNNAEAPQGQLEEREGLRMAGIYIYIQEEYT